MSNAFLPPATQPQPAIGEIIKEAKQLTAEQIEQVMALQCEKGLRFGEAAVTLGFISREDVLWALSRQFNYTYAPAEVEQLNTSLVAAVNPFSTEAEYFREARSNLLAGVWSDAALKGQCKVLSVVSPDRGDGRSVFAANLAITFSQMGERTLLLDADMRSGGLASLMGVVVRDGLSGALARKHEPVVIQPLSTLPHLYMLPSGVIPPNPLELLLNQRSFDVLLAMLRERFSTIIIDTPAASAGADWKVISAVSGAALAMAVKGQTRMRPLKDLTKFAKLNVRDFAGVVMREQ